MLSFLRQKESFYKSVFGSSPDPSHILSGTFESIEEKLASEANSISMDYWFQFPEMVQIAADTFSRAIACYTPDNQSTTFVPYFSSPSTTLPILLQLHNSHFYIIEIKPKSRPRWPRTFVGHSFNCKRFSLIDYTLMYE